MAKASIERVVPLIVVMRSAVTVWWVWCVVNGYRGAELPILGYVGDERGLIPAFVIGLVCAVIAWIVWIVVMFAIAVPLAAFVSRKQQEPGE
jgi:hypothetical protein